MLLAPDDTDASARWVGRKLRFLPANAELALGALHDLRSADAVAGNWAWTPGEWVDPFAPLTAPRVASVPPAHRNLDGVRVRDQLAIFSGHGCDVWNGVLWPALVALPEIADLQFEPTNTLRPDESLLLACGVALVGNPDVLLLDLSSTVHERRASSHVRQRLGEVADMLQVAIVIVGET
jgi:hypothetical protein